jgi:apolipoprotein D and lipocalin family protein
MPRLTALLVVLLAGCGAPPPAGGRFRAQVPIYSNATLDPARLAGQWHQSAAFAAPGAAPCRAGGASIARDLSVTAALCLDGQPTRLQGRLRPSGPGRVVLPGAPAPLDGEWWVLWADVDYRTLAIGTPDGRFGMVLNRGGPVPPDRVAAARELFDFNGYDLSRLVMLP